MAERKKAKKSRGMIMRRTMPPASRPIGARLPKRRIATKSMMIAAVSLCLILACESAAAQKAPGKLGITFGAPSASESIEDARLKADGSLAALSVSMIGKAPAVDTLVFINADGAAIGKMDFSRAPGKKDGTISAVDAMTAAPDNRFAVALSHRKDDSHSAISVAIYGRDYKLSGVFKKLAKSGERSRTVAKIIPSSDGGFAAVGHVVKDEGAHNGFFLKLDSEGKHEMMSEIPGPATLNVIAEKGDGGFFVAGRMKANNSGNIFVSHIAGDWRLSFAKELTDFEADGAVISAISPFSDGGCVIAGYFPPPGIELYKNRSPYLWKVVLDKSGAVAHTDRVFIDVKLRITAMSEVSDGGFVVAGSHKKSEDIVELFIQKVDRNFSAVWVSQFAGPNATATVKTASEGPGNVFVAAGATGGEDSQAWIQKFDASGKPQW